jgi:hypothetical protein
LLGAASRCLQGGIKRPPNAALSARAVLEAFSRRLPLCMVAVAQRRDGWAAGLLLEV